MTLPLVTIICVSYNHARWVEEAIDSVMHQTYPRLQVIIVDDGSSDSSQDIIRRLKQSYPSLILLLLETNHGYCKAFNKALRLAEGEYIIDFATDDIMMPPRVEEQVSHFNRLEKNVGVVFTDAEYIDGGGNFLRRHFADLFKKRRLTSVPEGDVYREVISKYFIPAPTMMIRREVLAALKGYDEELAYEDFDFWIRSSRVYQYAFLNKCLMKIRRTAGSLSSRQYVPGDKQLYSTYLVCKKIHLLNRTEDERRALISRVRFELRHATLSDNFAEAMLFYKLLDNLGGTRWADRAMIILAKASLPLKGLRDMYLRMRYGSSHG